MDDHGAVVDLLRFLKRADEHRDVVSVDVADVFETELVDERSRQHGGGDGRVLLGAISRVLLVGLVTSPLAGVVSGQLEVNRLLFAVPFEAPLIPVLVDWTSKIAVGAIELTGVPVLREGAYFVLPTGAWSVADTCSGIAFFTTTCSALRAVDE